MEVQEAGVIDDGSISKAARRRGEELLVLVPIDPISVPIILIITRRAITGAIVLLVLPPQARQPSELHSQLAIGELLVDGASVGMVLQQEQALPVRWNAFLVLKFGHDVGDRIGDSHIGQMESLALCRGEDGDAHRGLVLVA